MSGRIVAINCSPRKGWNTDMLITEAVRGAEEAGYSTEKFDLYRLEHFTGCLSCFSCKRAGHEGECVLKDGLTDVLTSIKEADGLILGTPIYFGDVTAGFRALYERIMFPNLTYQKERMTYSDKKIPVLLIVTSNAPEAAYSVIGYKKMLNEYCKTLKNFVGPAKLLISGETQQVPDYSKYNWTMIDGAKHVRRRQEVFPKEMEKAYMLGKDLLG